MLRAVQNAGSAITTVVPVEDPYFAVEWTNNLQPEIMKMIASCPPTFDQTRLFDEMGAVVNTEGNVVDIQSRWELKQYISTFTTNHGVCGLRLMQALGIITNIRSQDCSTLCAMISRRLCNYADAVHVRYRKDLKTVLLQVRLGCCTPQGPFRDDAWRKVLAQLGERQWLQR